MTTEPVEPPAPESPPIPQGLAEFARQFVADTAPPATPEQQLRIAQICAGTATPQRRKTA